MEKRLDSFSNLKPVDASMSGKNSPRFQTDTSLDIVLHCLQSDAWNQ